MKKTLSVLALICAIFYGWAQDRTDSLHIAHYGIHLNITDFATRQVYGFTDLKAVAKVNALSHIDLDLQRLVVDSVWVNGVAETGYSHTGNLLRINLQQPMNQDDTANVRVFYSGQPATDSHFGGFYFSGEYAYNLGVAFRDLPHNFGRAWYPCLDFFTDKSAYDFYIQTEVGKMAVCGGELLDSALVSDDTREWHWLLEEPVPTYLTSVAVGDYRHYADTVQGVERVLPIDIYVSPSKIGRVPATFAHLKDALHIFEMRFGAYPWSRIGYVGVDFTGGAMEHVTNIAYPNAAITGNATYESLYIHEFSHMWFGDLVTCGRAEEMWLNEGFARYCEAVADEMLYPSENPLTDGYRKNIRELHRNVLKKAHDDDGGYWALDSMPQAVTYGTTTYDKGALAVHTLRKYMGDSLFFAAIRDYLNTYAYQNISSPDFFAFLSQSSGMQLQDFYEGWIHQPGFLHYSVDSVHTTGNANEYRFFVRQRLSHARHFANGNKIDITFYSADNQQSTLRDFTFDGEFGEGVVSLPFVPTATAIDIDEKLADAVVDYNFDVAATGNNSASAAGIVFRVEELNEPTFVRVEDNYVSPDPLKTENEDVIRISNTHYWRIVIPDESAIGERSVRFTIRNNDANQLDYDLLQGYAVNNLVLLYRRDAADDWRIIPASLSGANYIVSSEIASGEYALAIGNGLGIQEVAEKPTASVYPNPAKDYLHIALKNANTQRCFYQILNMAGKIVDAGEIQDSHAFVNTKKLRKGVFIIRIMTDNQEVNAFKFVKE